MYIVMISANEWELVENKDEAIQLTEELAKSKKVYFFELKNVVETKLSWNKPSKAEKISKDKIEGKELPFLPIGACRSFVLPVIEDTNFEVYPSLRECNFEPSELPDLSIMNNQQIEHQVEIFDSEFEKKSEVNLETENEKKEINDAEIESLEYSEITDKFEVQEISNNEALEIIDGNVIVKESVIISTPEITPPADKVETTEKRFTLTIGTSNSQLSEENVKKQCEIFFKESLEKDDPIQALKDQKSILENWYKKDLLENIDWFQNLYAKYLPLASKKALLKEVNNEAKESPKKNTPPLENLLAEFEKELKEASLINESRVFDVANNKKYSELIIKKKAQFLALKDFHVNEGMINDLVSKIGFLSGDPEELVKGYSQKIQKDKRVQDALKARKGFDESIFKDDSQIIEEIKMSNQDNYSEIYLKYSKLSLTNKDIQKAFEEKQNELNQMSLLVTV